MKNRLRRIKVICVIAMIAFSLFSCSNESNEKNVTESTTAPAPTQGIELEYDENGDLTPESKYLLWQQQQEQEAKEAYEKEQIEEIEKWYMQQPEHNPDDILPGGH